MSDYFFPNLFTSDNMYFSNNFDSFGNDNSYFIDPEDEFCFYPDIIDTWIDLFSQGNNQHRPLQQNNLLSGRCRSPQRKIILSDEAVKLKSGYYSTFTFSKTFPKKYLLEIHRKILSVQLGFPKMTRAERRQKDLYFQNYASKKDQILNCLEFNKDHILNTILTDIKKIKNK